MMDEFLTVKPLIFPSSQIKCRTCNHQCDKCIDILNEEKREKAYSGHYKEHTLCWCCELSVKGGCEWADYKLPVPGWVARRTNKVLYKSYKVIDCPKFKRGR